MEVYTRTVAITDKLTLVPFGDAHLGARACDNKKVKRALQRILDTPDAYVIGMGDYIDLVTRQDLKRFAAGGIAPSLVDQIDTLVDAQRELLIETLKPLAEAGRILGLCEGNHESEITKRYSTSVVREVCKVLNVPYLGYSCLYRLHITRRGRKMGRNLIIYAHHGFGGGKTMGAAINRRVGLVQDFDADIYLMGHDHAYLTGIKPRLSISSYGAPRLIAKPVACVATGSFLKGYEQGTTTYVEKAGLSPVMLGTPTIEVSFAGHKEELEIHVSQ